MAFSIQLGEIFIAAYEQERADLSLLDDDEYSHVHGELRIYVDGKLLPCVGFFSPDDVCLNDWAGVLWTASSRLRADESGIYVFDEGEQGQPAFVFQREGDRVLISVVDSELGDGRADPAWDRVPCGLDEFLDGASQFLWDLRERVRQKADPVEAERWWSDITGTDS